MYEDEKESKNRALVENVKGKIAEAHKEKDLAKVYYENAAIYYPENDEYFTDLKRVENLLEKTQQCQKTQQCPTPKKEENSQF